MLRFGSSYFAREMSSAYSAKKELTKSCCMEHSTREILDRPRAGNGPDQMTGRSGRAWKYECK